MDQAAEPNVLVSLAPMIFMQLIFVGTAWWLAPKMGKTRWLLAALCAIPILGMLIGMLLPLISLGSVLDKLNKLLAGDKTA